MVSGKRGKRTAPFEETSNIGTEQEGKGEKDKKLITNPRLLSLLVRRARSEDKGTPQGGILSPLFELVNLNK